MVCVTPPIGRQVTICDIFAVRMDLEIGIFTAQPLHVAESLNACMEMRAVDILLVLYVYFTNLS